MTGKRLEENSLILQRTYFDIFKVIKPVSDKMKTDPEESDQVRRSYSTVHV